MQRQSLTPQPVGVPSGYALLRPCNRMGWRVACGLCGSGSGGDGLGLPAGRGELCGPFKPGPCLEAFEDLAGLGE